MSAKRGAYVRLGDGAALDPRVEAGLGAQHDLQFQLADFDAIFSVKTHEQGHINIEEGRALVCGGSRGQRHGSATGSSSSLT